MPSNPSLTTNLPQAGSWPLLGALPALLTRPFEFFEEARRRHGDLYALRVGPLRPVVLNHPRHVQHVLRDHAANYRKGGMLWDNARKLMGNGLLVSEGEFWLRQRRMMQPQFHRERLAGLTGLMVNAIDESLAGWAPHAVDGRPVNLAPALAHLTMRVTTDSLFGAALPRESRDEVGDAMAYVTNYLMIGIVAYGLPSWVPVPGKRRNLREIARLERIVGEIVATTRRDQGKHLLAMLLDVVDEQTGEGMNSRQLHDEVMTMFLAGYETTSTALGWALHFLMSHPDVLQKLQEEVDGALSGRAPGFADLPQLSYTRMVLQEVLRLRPPGPFVPRVAIADDAIDGFRIAAGTEVLALTYMVHRHPDVWPDPEHFDPERFAGDHGARGSSGRNPFAWIPFGIGQRLCIGRDFAMMEGTLALAMIVQRYRFTAVKGRIAMPGLSTTMRLKGGLWAHLAGRDRA